MKYISSLHKKQAAERDSKALRKIYIDKAKPSAEANLGPSPTGAQETRQQYFERLNNYIFDNTTEFDKTSPFSIDGINFVHTIPEDSLTSMEKKDRQDFIRWIARNYDNNKDIFTIENCIMIKSFIEVSPEYEFSSIGQHDPKALSSKVTSRLEMSKEVDQNFSTEDAMVALKVDRSLFSEAKNMLLSSIENDPEIAGIFSEEEVFFLAAGAALTDGLNNIGLMIDFITAVDSDIGVDKPGDLKALYLFDLKDPNSIEANFTQLNESQEEWHIRNAEKSDKAENNDGVYGYGYKTDIVKYRFKDGWKMVYIPSKDDPNMVPWDEDSALSHDRIQEGNNQSICLGSTMKMFNDNKSGSIYSLRDPSNKPKATMRIEWDGTKQESGDWIYLHEVRESHNRSAGIEASIYLTEFLNHFGIPPDNETRERWVKNIDEESIVASAEKKDDLIFEWISFINKNRQSDRYAKYNKHYNRLIQARNQLFSETNGRFINPTSIEKDPRRVRQYISKMLSHIASSGSLDENASEFTGRLFSRGIVYNDSLWAILDKVPGKERALDIIIRGEPESAFVGLNKIRYKLSNYPWAKDGLKKAGKTLLSSGEFSYIGMALKNMGLDTWDSIFSPEEIREECSRPEVISWLEKYFDHNEDDFIEKGFLLIYFGENQIIKDARVAGLKQDLNNGFQRMQKSKSYNKSGLNDKAIYALRELGGKVEEGEAHSLMSWAAEGIDSEIDKHDPKSVVMLKLSPKYIQTFLIANRSLSDDAVPEDIKPRRKELADQCVKAFVDNLMNSGWYTDAAQISEKAANTGLALGILGSGNDELEHSLRLHLNEFYHRSLRPTESNLKKNRFLDTKNGFNKFVDIVSKRIPGVSLGGSKELTFADEDVLVSGVSLDKLKELSEVNEEDIRAFVAAREGNVSYYFSSLISRSEGNSDLNEEMMETLISTKFKDSYYGDVTQVAEARIEEIEEITSNLKFNRSQLLRVYSYIDKTLDEFVAEILEKAEGVKKRNKNNPYGLKDFEKDFLLARELLSAVKKSRSIKNIDLSSKWQQLDAVYDNSEDFFATHPESYFRLIEAGFTPEGVDPRGLALKFVQNLISERLQRHQVEGTQGIAEKIMELLGLTATAKALGIFFIKNGFAKEFEDLCLITNSHQYGR
jgi:hypothetical protein